MSASYGQQVKSHTVQSGETIYSICKANNITQEQLQAANPSLSHSQLRAGQIIQLPIIQQTEKKELRFDSHKVRRKETLYGIAKRYHITIDDVFEYNPWAKKGIRKKDILRIPNAADLTAIKAAAELEKQKEEALSKINSMKHEVKSGETLYGISKKYNRTIEALLAENPQAASGLKVGMVLSISEVLEEGDKPKAGQVAYRVKTGDTAYRIAKNYHITVDELYAANPIINKQGLQTDMVLVIPSKEQQPTPSDKWVHQPATTTPSLGAQNQSYHVALLLPLSAAEYAYQMTKQTAAPLDAPDKEEKKSSTSIAVKSRSFLQMYQGMMLAIEQMRTQGMQVTVRLFDTENSLATVKNIVSHPDFKRANLIIGPIYPQIQAPIANYAQQHQVPMISPLSSGGNMEASNPYYFKVNIADQLIRRKTQHFLANNFRNYQLLLMKVGGAGHFSQLEQFKQNFAGYAEHDAQSEQLDALKRKLGQAGDTLHQRNVVYIPFDDETKVSIGVGALNSAAASSQVTLVGQYNFTKFKSIQTEYYHQVDLHMLSPYYIDYSSAAVNDFVRNYRSNFYAEPSQFAFQGYDVAYYFLNTMFHYGTNIGSAVSSHHPKLLQGNFKFMKVSPAGGWQNEGLFLLEYKPDFTIVKKGEM